MILTGVLSMEYPGLYNVQNVVRPQDMTYDFDFTLQSWARFDAFV